MGKQNAATWLKNHRAVLIVTMISVILYGCIVAYVLCMNDGHIDDPFNPDTYDFLDAPLPPLPVVNPDKVPVPDAGAIYIGDMLDKISIPDALFEVKFSRVVDETFDGQARKAGLGMDRYIAVVATMKYVGEEDGMQGEYVPMCTVFDDENSKACDLKIRKDNEWVDLPWVVRNKYDFEVGKTYDVIFYCDRSEFMGNVGIRFYSTDRQMTSINLLRGER